MSSKFTLLFSVFATLRFTSSRARLEYAKMAATFTTDSSYIHAPLHPAVCKEDTLSITNVESCMREILYQI